MRGPNPTRVSAGRPGLSQVPQTRHRKRAHAPGFPEAMRRGEDPTSAHVVFQPIVELATERVVGVEALSGFDDDRPPEMVFANACTQGRGAEFELTAVKEALRAIDDLPSDVYLSLNLSTGSLIDPRVRDALASAALSRVVLEIVDHQRLAEEANFRAELDALRKLGARVAFDDVSGLVDVPTIIQLAPDIIKLDIDVTRNIDRAWMYDALTTLLAVGRGLGTQVVAEGVEERQQLLALRLLQVDCAQGFLLGKPEPLPLDETHFDLGRVIWARFETDGNYEATCGQSRPILLHSPAQPAYRTNGATSQ